MSRPPEGVGHVDRLDGPEDLKWRLRVLLETIVGSISVTQACEELGVSESRLHELRRQALVGALGALMPKPAGRPATAETTTAREKAKGDKRRRRRPQVRAVKAMALLRVPDPAPTPEAPEASQ